MTKARFNFCDGTWKVVTLEQSVEDVTKRIGDIFAKIVEDGLMMVIIMEKDNKAFMVNPDKLTSAEVYEDGD